MELKFDKTKTYILACSFGPDSMALFNMLLKQGYKFVVCHVNYNTRKESNYEAKSLYEFCKKHNIKMYLKSVKHSQENGNFEAWAREVRYSFFKEIYDKFNADGVFVAHHQDDLLETYIMQKQRNMIIPFYGIESKTILMGMNIYRPLLGVTKDSLLTYCKVNDIPFSIDSTNLENIHTRNKIRHTIIEKLSDEERLTLINELNDINDIRKKETENIKECFESSQIINIERLLLLEENAQVFALYSLVMNYGSLYSMTRRRALEIIKIVKCKKPNVKILLKDDLYLVKEYGKLSIQKYSAIEGYNYIVTKPSILKTPYFEIDFTKNTDNRNVFDYDYPLTIRTYEPGDYILINNVRRKVRRLFIDWKMPESVRKYWPIFVDNKNQIIYIPRYKDNFIQEEESNLKIFIQ